MILVLMIFYVDVSEDELVVVPDAIEFFGHWQNAYSPVTSWK